MSDDTIPTEPDRAEVIAGIRAYCDWLEAHPEVEVPKTVYGCEYVPPEKMAEAAKRLGGSWEKHGNESFFEIQRRFGPVAKHGLYASRDAVCERVVVGTEQRVVNEPDPDAVAALPKVERVETVEKVEWRCPPSLHALSEG